MKTIFHKSGSRGHADHGWLNAYHSFSFAGYHNPEKMNFGVLRVLNDDTVSGGMGFSAHPHRDMEIITIPLEGDLKHGDNMGNEGIISNGEIQLMSAGTGVIHSEKNANHNKEVKLLQIWVFPRELNVTPRYDQISIKNKEKKNDFQQILSPNADDEGVWIHQDAWFSLAKFDKDFSKEYKLHKDGNGVYVFVINGSAKIGNQVLEKRDGFGTWDTDSFVLEASEDSKILLMEIPMQLPEYLK